MENEILHPGSIVFHPARLLIVDDSDIRSKVTEYLKGYEFELSYAINISDAEKNIYKNKPHLILVTIEIAEELVEYLKNNDPTKDIPIIIITDSKTRINTDMEKFCESCLQTPINKSELIKELSIFLPFRIQDISNLIKKGKSCNTKHPAPPLSSFSARGKKAQ